MTASASSSQTAARARAHRRRILRRLRTRASDLDALTAELLHQYTETAARRDALEPDSERLWTASNTTARLLARLEARLRELGLAAVTPAPTPLERYLADRDNGSDDA